MQLKEILDEIGIDLDHDPTGVAVVRDARARVANRHYLQVSQQYPWLFLQQETTLSVRGDFAPTGAQTAAFTAGQFEVVPSFTPQSYWAGQVLVGPDGLDYTIAASNELAKTIYLTTAYAGTTVAASSSWSIRQDRLFAPVDCAEALGFTDRDRNWIRLLHSGRRSEEFAVLDRAAAGDALVIVEDDWIQDRPPDFAPTLASSASAGSLRASTTYQYCYTFVYRGLESAPSPVSEVATGANNSVAISVLENTQVGGLATGRYKRIYRRDKTRNGRWQRLEGLFSETDGATGTLTDTGTGDYVATANELFEAEPVRSFRAYWRPADNATAQTVYLRYLRRVRRLYADADVPLWPAEYHHLIVYMAEVDIYMSSGADTKANARRVDAERLLQRMKEQHLSTPDERYVRGSWASRYGGWTPPVTVTSDFSG